MADIFISSPGQISVMKGSTLPGSVSLLDNDTVPGREGADVLTGKSDLVIITQINYEQPTNTQFMHCLNKAVYIYSFGDRIGRLVVSGLAFSLDCNSVSKGGKPSGNSKSGIEVVLDYYKLHKVSSRVTKPIYIAIGQQIIKGFLIGSQIATHSLEMMTNQFTLEIATLPEATP